MPAKAPLLILVAMLLLFLGGNRPQGRLQGSHQGTCGQEIPAAGQQEQVYVRRMELSAGR
jgi:hypothetical protein